MYGPVQNACNHTMYQHEPQLGYYCLYRRRAWEDERGWMPDCPDIPKVLAQHSRWMRGAGLEYAVQDGTNWGAWPSSASDVFQLRSAEVVAEEWAALRQQGEISPDWGIWNALNGDWTLWQQYLNNIYNNETFEAVKLMHRDKRGNKVFWVVNADRRPKPISFYDSYGSHEESTDGQDRRTGVQDDKNLLINATSVFALASNGGKEDITVQFAWQDTPLPPFWQNRTGAGTRSWAYLGQCQDQDVLPGVPCQNPVINDTALGSVLVVNTNNALDSLPFGASGKRHGLVIKKQFATAFRTPVDYIYLPSWNEYPVAGQNKPWGIQSPYLAALGLKLDDTARAAIYVDGWGEAKSRTIEPSVDDDGLYLDVLASCIRVARLAEAGEHWRRAIVGDDVTSDQCSVAGELCCQRSDPEYLSLVWSMQLQPPSTSEPSRRVQAAALTGRPQEVQALERLPGWEQVCSPYGSYGGVCTNTSVLWNEPYFQGVRGPFMLLSNMTEPENIPFETVGIVRCSAPAFSSISSDAAFSFGIEGAEGPMGCGAGYGKIDYLLGYAALDRSAGSKMPRELRKCQAAGGQGSVHEPRPRDVDWGASLPVYYHTLDAACQSGD